MRRSNVSKRPFERGGGGFSAAKKLEPDKPSRIPTIDDLMEEWKGRESARAIIREAKKMGIGPDRFGESDEKINHSIGAASLKFSMRNIGYCKPVYAVASMIMANNDLDTSKWLINEMTSKVDGEVMGHLKNISAIMEEARNLGLGVEDLGSKTREFTADEIVRVATNRKYSSAKNALAIIMINQEAERAKEVILKEIVPKCDGSELYNMNSYIQGRVNRNKMDADTGKELIVKISERLDHLWMA